MIEYIILWIFSGTFTWNIVYNSFKRDHFIRKGIDWWKTPQGRKDIKWFRWLILPMLILGPIALVTFTFTLLVFKVRPVYYFEIKPEDYDTK